ncbi:DUF397 domain-containing protein [Kitasatospora nipponensis]
MIDQRFTAARWRKSIGSGDTNCVEVAIGGPVVGVRDTKDRGTGPILAFEPAAWAVFLDGVRDQGLTSDGTAA